ncbi:hypothetical protein G4B88_023550 [Cannabis sativa]|uniref:Leucine-rich repeat-containing N-terminal plant-type domain-containing protein n=1 Tax=Cannabis sativa TaxID=3483 RepID=A0A7J6HUS3_CANSA|nr:hypothetical protein G4B88_023550 [Cannabis sativa]
MAAISVSMTIHVTTIIMFFMFVENVFGNGVGESSILCHEAEKQALLSFKKDLVDDYNKLVSWNISEEEDCCKWAGISCNAHTGHVSELSLRDGSLTGKINPSLLNLTHLANLDLSLNNFGGIQIPSFVDSFVSLRYLNLTYAEFKGMIPQQLGNLSSLLYLGLGHNLDLYVDNLHWVSSLSSLESLDLSYVNLSSIPCTFRNNMSLLIYLNLSSNNIDSVIPNCFYSFSNLEHLHLSNTNLHGIISSDVANLTSIVNLNLRGNALAGKIPSFMGKLCNLEEFDLAGNNYKGSVSMVFESLSGCLSKSLKSLNLGGNKFDSFTGQILDEMRDFKNLLILSLSNNIFSGPIPMSIFGNLISLKTLDLSSNNFSGPLPEFPVSLSNLEALYIFSNKLSGSLPKSLQLLSKLKTLFISNNQISGSLPRSFGSLSNLEILWIDSNNFKGDLSEIHFANLTKLKFVYASGNKLSMKVNSNWVPPFSLLVLELRNWNLGPHFPMWLKSQKNISQIDISNTGISSVIPQWFWNNFFSNHFIRVDKSENQIYGKIPNFPNDISCLLNMSFNELTGPIPSIPISDMLDLSNNYLSGNIPDCWKYWPKLIMIDLDNNNLNGIIPSSIGFLRNLHSLHLRNNSLVGKIPKALKNCSALIGLDLGLNKLVGTIPRWIGSLPSLGLLILRSNNLTGLIPIEMCKLLKLQILDASNNNLMGRIPRCFKNLMSMTSKSADQYLTSFYFSVDTQEARENVNLISRTSQGTNCQVKSQKNLRVFKDYNH